MLFGWKNMKRIVNTVCYIDTNRQHCLFIHRTGEDFIQNSESKSKGNTIYAYGAPAKGNTLLNYCGITSEIIDKVVEKRN